MMKNTLGYVIVLVSLIVSVSACAPLHKSKDPQKREDAVAKLEDQNILYELALKDPSFGVRYEAAKKITDIEMVETLISNEKDELIWELLLSRNESLYAKVALGDFPPNKKLYAARKAFPETDHYDGLKSKLGVVIVELSEDIAEQWLVINEFSKSKLSFSERDGLDESSDLGRKEFNRQKFSDDALLKILNSNRINEEAKEEAADHIENTEQRMNIALNHPSLKVRIKAAKNFYDEKNLYHLLKHSRDDKIKQYATTKLISRGDPQFIRSIALDDGCESEIRELAVEKLDDVKLIQSLKNTPGLEHAVEGRLLHLSAGKKKICQSIKLEACHPSKCIRFFGRAEETGQNRLTLNNHLDLGILAVVAKLGLPGADFLDHVSSCCWAYYLKPMERREVKTDLVSGRYAVFYVFSDDVTVAYKGQKFDIKPKSNAYSELEIEVKKSILDGRALVRLD